MKTVTGNSLIKPVLLVTIILILICGLLYPLLVTGIAQILMPGRADGSLVYINGTPVGSKIVGQLFEKPYFFHSRPSAVNYNTVAKGDECAVASGANNFGASNPLLKERMEEEIALLLEQNPTLNREDIPVDMVTQSGSGLDPHVSVQNAYLQADRIAKASGLDKAVVTAIIDKCTEGKTLGFLGEEKVNVLKANLELALQMGLIQSYQF